ncbi:MAG: VCBS repeat-containing protein, partial [Cyclobacteriaceae bacterium]
NGSVEQVVCYYNGDTAYPMALKHDLVNQIPPLKEKYSKYEYYRGQTIEDIFSPEQIDNSVSLKANQLRSSIILNDGDGTFTVNPLPLFAQLSPVYASLVEDFNSDGNPDILIGGNLYNVKPEVGRYDASYGLLLMGNGDGTFVDIQPEPSGLRLQDEVRDLISIKTNNKNLVIASRNNESLQVFQRK